MFSMEKLRGEHELWGLKWQDIMVIFSLWLLEYVRPWFGGWHWFTYNLNLQRVASFEITVFTCECFMTLSLSLICDLRHGKYRVYMYFIYLYGIFSIYGFVETLLPSFTLRFMMDWLQSTSGIIFPIQFCAVFIQKPNISRMNSYIWITIFELVGALNQFAVPFVIPYHCPLRNNGILSIWIVLFLYYCQVLYFTSCTYSKHVKPEDFPEKHIKAAIQGIKRDCKVDNDVVWWKFGRKTLKFLIFILLAIPVIFATFMMECLQLLEIRQSLNRQNFLSTSNMMPFGRVIGITASGTGLTAVRKLWPKIADVMTLGVPHALNLLAITMITIKLSHYRTGDIIVGTLPDKSSMVLLFINTDYNNRSACIYSKDFEPMRIRALEHLTRIVRTDKAEIELIVVLDPTYETFVPVRYYVKVEKDSYITFMVQLGTIPLHKGFVLNAVQLIRVKGTEAVRPKEEPQYVWMTSISDLANRTELRVSRNNNGSSEVHELPKIGKAIVESVPTVITNISVVHTYSSSNMKSKEYLLADSYGVPKPWTVYAVLIHEHNRQAKLAVESQRVRPSLQNMWPSRTIVRVITIMQLKRVASSNIASREILREDPVLAASYFIHGAATSLVQIGYLHLLWKDAPLRLRTFQMAVVLVISRSLALLPGLEDIDYYSGSGVVTFDLSPMYILLIFQLAFTLMHFGLARIFYYTLDRNIANELSEYKSVSDKQPNKP